MHIWNMGRKPERLKLTKFILLAALGLGLVGCETTKTPPGPLWPIIQTCSSRWDVEIGTKLTAKYEDLTKGGEVEWKAAVEAGGMLLNFFKDEAIDKSQALVLSLYGLPYAKFLIFSRLPPENPTPGLCKRWKRQVNFFGEDTFKDRLVFYPMPHKESNFTGKAGIEISQVVRCQSGLDATDYCAVYLRKITKEVQQQLANSSCISASG